jgi:hydroxymethylpyrimidine pyrophosphatase-like HAD family hydrolase
MHNPYMVDREVTLTLRGEVSVAQANSLLANEPLPLQLVDNGVVHPREHTLQNVSEVHSYHLMPRGAGKAQAVAASMVSRGLQPEQTVAIGDSVGDMAMGAHTGSIVMVSSAAKSGVAQAALAARAQTGEPVPRAFCTTHPTSDGWAEFANALLAAKG